MNNTSKIYTIAVKYTYDLYKISFFKYRFKKRDYTYRWASPIFANSEEEAIDIFKMRYDVDRYGLSLWEGKGRNIVKEVVCVSSTEEYSIEELQKRMNSNDFLHYCRQELGLEQTINSLLK